MKQKHPQDEVLDRVLGAATRGLAPTITERTRSVRDALAHAVTLDSGGAVVSASAWADVVDAVREGSDALADGLGEHLQAGSREVQTSAIAHVSAGYSRQARERGRPPADVDEASVAERAVAARDVDLDRAAEDFAGIASDDIEEFLSGDLAVDVEDPEDLDAVVAAAADAVAERWGGRLAMTLLTEFVASRTEAAIETLRDIAEDDPAVGKEWVAEDEMCADCEDIDAEVVGPDEDFSDGSDGPPAHPNCRCRVEPSVD